MSWRASSVPPEPTDNANVSFVTYKGDFYVSTETNIMHKVDPETLEAIQKVRKNTVVGFLKGEYYVRSTCIMLFPHSVVLIL